MGMFDWTTVLQNLVNQRVEETARNNAAAVNAYNDKKANWIEVNSISRDRVQNVGFVPTPLPVIPHKQGVDRTTAEITDLGPFPDLVPPVLPEYKTAVSSPLAKQDVPDPIGIMGQMLLAMSKDIAAIRKAVGA